MVTHFGLLDGNIKTSQADISLAHKAFIKLPNLRVCDGNIQDARQLYYGVFPNDGERTSGQTAVCVPLQGAGFRDSEKKIKKVVSVPAQLLQGVAPGTRGWV